MTEFLDYASNWTNNAAFSPPSSWAYDSPASHYFWAGFVVSFGLGLLSLAMTWVRRLIAGGNSEL